MNRIFDIKKLLSTNKSLLALLLVLGLGVMLVIISNTSAETTKKTENLSLTANENINTADNVEIKLEKTLKKAKGVGDIEIMIIYASSDEKILAKDVDSQGAEKTVSKSESSKSEPYIIKTKLPEIDGVIVVAQGGDDVNVKNMLIDCISSTLNIPFHKVKILKMN